MLRPLAESRWNETTAAHLLNRAGFGGAPAEIEKLRAMGVSGAVGHLVDYDKIPESVLAPAWAKPDPERFEKQQALRALDEGERRKAQQADQRLQGERMGELRAWWLARMSQTPRPLQEKLTLFWHGHFATSVQKVKETYYMWLQNETFRRLASGRWLDLLAAVAKDPAMLIWLDQAQSQRHKPNENFARELLELFTLGEGHYTEEDVREAARAFTGLTLDRRLQTGEFSAKAHDPGVKTVLGRTGRLTWMDVLEEVVSQPRAARFIVGKLWRFFVFEEPPQEVVEALAEVFRGTGHHFKPVLRTLFLSEAFYAPEVIRSQIKSPVQWLVGSVRMLERDLPSPPAAAQMMAGLGQDLFAPPHVNGWEGGRAWITTSQLLGRYNQAAVLVYGRSTAPRPGPKRRPGRAAPKPGQNQPPAGSSEQVPVSVERICTGAERASRETLLEALQRRFLQSSLPPKQQQALRDYLDSQGTIDDQDILETVRLLMSTPAYQLT